MEITLHTTDEVATVLRVLPQTIRQYIRDKKVKATKIGKEWRVSESELARLTTGE